VRESGVGIAGCPILPEINKDVEALENARFDGMILEEVTGKGSLGGRYLAVFGRLKDAAGVSRTIASRLGKE
jgi:hypothetical protein